MEEAKAHGALAPVCEVLGLQNTGGEVTGCCCLCSWLFPHRLGKTNRAEYLASEIASLQPVSTLGSQFWCRLTEVASLQNESPEMTFLSVSSTLLLPTLISCPLSEPLCSEEVAGQSPFLAVDRGPLVACTLGTLFKMVSLL